jgi:hypothetical protein
MNIFLIPKNVNDNNRDAITRLTRRMVRRYRGASLESVVSFTFSKVDDVIGQGP